MTLTPDFELGALLGSNLADSETLIPGQLNGFPLGVLALDGADTIIGSIDAERINGNQGDDLIQAGAGNDFGFGGQGNDIFNGQENEDILFGNIGEDTLDGGEGFDILFGGKNNDQLIGGPGNDILSGDLGVDTLTGGEGEDIFFTEISPAEPDLITDFQVGFDEIHLPAGVESSDLQFTEPATNQILVTVESTGEEIVILENIGLQDIMATDFVSVIDNGIKQLNSIPVFIVTDQADVHLSYMSAFGVKTFEVFFDQDDAIGLVNNIGSENPDFANSLEIQTVPLGQVYQRQGSDTSGVEIVYVPDSEQVENAEAILGTDVTGVPIFRILNDQGLITLLLGGDKIGIPAFFDLEDSQGILDIYKQRQPDQATFAKIEVDSLESYITSFETADSLFVNLFSLVP